MRWEVRKAEPRDAAKIVELARDYDEFLMPYVLNEFIVSQYIDQFMVAERVEHLPSPHYEIGGAVHYIPEGSYKVNPIELDKVSSFLHYVKQVPEDIILQLVNSSATAFLCQVVCPGKGSFYTILEELKSRYDELWCWMSEVGPSFESYVRYSFNFVERRSFWNVYKCDYSTFALCKWKKGG